MSDLTGLQVAQFWTAASLHFRGKYDIAKYHWKTNVNEESFRASKNRFVFERLARQYETEARFKQGLGAVLYNNPKAYVRDMIMPNVIAINAINRHEYFYEKFQRDWESMSAFVGTEKAGKEWAQNIIEETISPESAVIMFDIFGWDMLPTWKIRAVELLPKYAPFVAYDKAKVFQIIKQCQTEA
jgi:hypothetical protein